MPSSVRLIPRNRLVSIPSHLRLAHEYCFFLHDECVRLVKEYEAAGASVVSIRFRDKAKARQFQRNASSKDAISAMIAGGFEAEARRVILNQVTISLVSDCLHHLYESLLCFERRKVVVALNLLRKPLLDSSLYLAWIYGDEDGFYREFLQNSPAGISDSILRQKRHKIISDALALTDLTSIFDGDYVCSVLFEVDNADGIYRLFQHAVHLVTVKRPEIRTTPLNFNFVFKSPDDNDVYEKMYQDLPRILLFLSHVVFGLFQRIAPSSAGGSAAFMARSILGLHFVDDCGEPDRVIASLDDLEQIKCESCGANLKLTSHNAARILLSESYRCVRCRRVNKFPFSWFF